MPNTVFVIGAGASLAAARARRPSWVANHPPLDANFFARVSRYRADSYRDRRGGSLFASVASRARALGVADIAAPDPPVSLEEHLGRLYFTAHHNPIAASVRDYFTLVDLYAREVINTTEWMVATRPARRGAELLRRLLQCELRLGNAVSIVTFNIDLLIEHTLELLAGSRPGAPWSLWDAYGFGTPLPRLTRNRRAFPYTAGLVSAIKTYKMHGSVNWAFHTHGYYPPADLMVNPRATYQIMDSLLGADRIQHQPPRGRRWMLFPLIVPPVYEKHALIRSHLSEVWQNAETALVSADHIVFWGYSFPTADVHARHFFEGLSQRNAAFRRPTQINPDPAAGVALWGVLRPERVSHFRDAESYLAVAEA